MTDIHTMPVARMHAKLRLLTFILLGLFLSGCLQEKVDPEEEEPAMSSAMEAGEASPHEMGNASEEAAGDSPEATGDGREAHLKAFAKDRFPSAATCAECHPRHYRQWSMSQHAYAQMSPVFNTMQARLNQLTNGTLGDFCVRCHTPTGLNLGEDPHMRNMERHPVSREGVSCVVCHRLKKPRGKVSGRLPLAEGPLTDTLFGPTGDNKILDELVEKQGLVTESDQVGRQVHGKMEKLGELTSGAFCGSCHDVTGVDGFRLEEAFSEWKHAPAADRGISCQDCHMGKRPGRVLGDPEDPAFDKKNYPHGPAAVVGGTETEPRRLTNHYFAGPDFSVLDPYLFPFNPAMVQDEDREGAAAEGLATFDEWRQFDWEAGWGTDEFEDKVFENPDQYEFPERWQTVDSRYAARELLTENLRKLKEIRERRVALMRNAIWIDEIVEDRAGPHGIDFRVRVRNITPGHGVPTGFDAERLYWLYVKVTDADGNVVMESGDLDPNGDVRDLHSKYVHNHELPHDEQLFSLQSKFITRNVRGSEREQILAVPYALTPLPFVNKGTRPNILYGRPFATRKHRKGIEALGHRWTKYHVSAEQLTRNPPYEVVVQFKVAMVPVNLLIAIQKAGFQYGMSTREVAERVTEGFVDENGNQVIWNPDSSDPKDNKLIGHEVIWERSMTFTDWSEE